MSSPTASHLREIADLPGPPGIPFLGNLLQIKRHRVHLDVEAWANTYGRVFRFKFAEAVFVGLADHEWVAQVLKERPHDFMRNQQPLRVGREMGLQPGVFTAEDDEWREQRRMVMASLSPGQVRGYFPKLQTVVQRLRGRWQKAARAGAAIPLQQDLMRYTVDGVAGLAFGTDMNTLESDQEVIQQHLDKIFPSVFRRAFAVIPYWRWFKLPRDRALDRSIVAIHEAVQGFIAQARARMRADPSLAAQPSNLLEGMIAAAEQGGGRVDDRAVAGNVMTMLLAGEDTTANTLAWMIWLLFQNPTALARATREVMQFAPRVDAYTPEQMASLDFIDACAMEALRLKPVAPFLIVQARHDTHIGDVRVPARTHVWCVLRHDSVDERLFPQARAFEPERWLTGEPSGAKRAAMPFGAGPRVCPGRYLAMLEIKMAMAMLLSSFDIEHVQAVGAAEPQEHMAFAMAPSALELRLRERSEQGVALKGFH